MPRGKQVHIQSYPREAVWLDGTSPVGDFVRDGKEWRSTLLKGKLDTTDPTRSIAPIRGSLLADPRIVLFDGHRMRRVGTPKELTPETFLIVAKRLFLGADPRGHTVRTSTLASALFIDGGDGSSVRGIGVTGYATSLTQLGAVRGYANRLVFDEFIATGNALSGLSLHGQGIRVSRSTLSDNGELGLQVHQSDRLTVSHSVMDENNYRGLPTQIVAGGIKITASRGTSILSNLLRSNKGTGLWLDESCVGATISGNVASNNSHHGVLFELSARGVFRGNMIRDNLDAGIRILDSNEADIEGNVFAGNHTAIDILDGPRMAGRGTFRGLDKRHRNDRTASWEVNDIHVKSNRFYLVDDSESIVVNDFRRKRSAQDMRVTLDADTFISATEPADRPVIVVWSRWPVDRPFLTGLAQIRLLGGQELHGRQLFANRLRLPDVVSSHTQ